MAGGVPPNNGSVVAFKGFGLELGARGAIVILFLLFLAIGGLGLYNTWRLERGQSKAAEVFAAALRDDHAQRDKRIEEIVAQRERQILEIATRRDKRDEQMTDALRKITCAAWYPPAERKTVRGAIEQNPAALSVWCP